MTQRHSNNAILHPLLSKSKHPLDESITVVMAPFEPVLTLSLNGLYQLLAPPSFDRETDHGHADSGVGCPRTVDRDVRPRSEVVQEDFLKSGFVRDGPVPEPGAVEVSGDVGNGTDEFVVATC